jgi:O-succinylbenzoate synthase
VTPPAPGPALEPLEPLPPVGVACIRLVRVRVPMVAPFRAPHGAVAAREVLLVNVETESSSGWGEDVALPAPTYLPEYLDASASVLEGHLVPPLLAAREVSAPTLDRVLGHVQGWEMARCALETALLDAQLRERRLSLLRYLGGVRTRIQPGVAVGLHPRVDDTVAEAVARVAEGYRRVKLKIEPGRDLSVVAAVRDALGPDVLLQVDANGAYTLDDLPVLRALDAFGLLFVEEPLARGDLLGHARLAAAIATPVCLDESVTTLASLDTALALRACSVVNVKPAKAGGLLAARVLHDRCVDAGVAAWCGGMLETGVGRAAALALAALPGFVYPPDLSASGRYFSLDLTEPFVMEGGALTVPDANGIGRVPDRDVLRSLGATTTERRA